MNTDDMREDEHHLAEDIDATQDQPIRMSIRQFCVLVDLLDMARSGCTDEEWWRAMRELEEVMV